MTTEKDKDKEQLKQKVLSNVLESHSKKKKEDHEDQSPLSLQLLLLKHKKDKSPNQ